MRRIREHLTYANVMATIAVFLVLTGGTAVALDGVDSVFSDDIVNGEVKAPDVAPNAINGSKIADNQVSTLDVRNDTLPGGGLVAGDLRPDSVRGSEVQDGSVTPADTETPTANIVQRIRGTASVPTGDGGPGSPTSYPLADNTWTQRADEVEFWTAEATVEYPQTCAGSPSGASIDIQADGRRPLFASFFWSPSEAGQTVTLDPARFVGADNYDFEPGAPDPHTATAQISDSCGGAGEDFIVHSVKVDVIGFR